MLKPRIHLLKDRNGKWPRLFLRCWVDGPDSSEDLPNQRPFGGIGKSVVGVPARERCQSLTQRVDRKRCRVIGEVPCDGIRRRWEHTLPFTLEVTNRRSVAAARILSLRCGNQFFELPHSCN